MSNACITLRSRSGFLVVFRGFPDIGKYGLALLVLREKGKRDSTYSVIEKSSKFSWIPMKPCPVAQASVYRLYSPWSAGSEVSQVVCFEDYPCVPVISSPSRRG